jgi:uncharacterized protein YjiK
MNRIFMFLLVFLSFSSQYSCNNDHNSKKDKTKETDLLQNYTVIKLPSDLDEISGISFIDNTNFVAIEDEDGIVYQYNLNEKKITDKKEFAEPGDYEDLAIAGEILYVMNSDGNLYEIKGFKKPGKIHAQKFKTIFSGKNNIESIAYDPQKNRLLIAPKDEGLDNDKDREIYELNLKTKILNTTPVYSISLQEIEEYFKGDALEESSKKFLKAIGNLNLNEVFRPSAMSIHPISHEIYVLSSLNNLIAVLTPAGSLRKIIELKGDAFLQPEGLAFTPDGQLYISNEGKGGKANIIHVNL